MSFVTTNPIGRICSTSSPTHPTAFREFTTPPPDPDEEYTNDIVRRVLLLLGHQLQPPPKAWLTTDDAAARADAYLAGARSRDEAMPAGCPSDVNLRAVISEIGGHLLIYGLPSRSPGANFSWWNR